MKSHAANETNRMIRNTAKRTTRFMMIAFLYVFFIYIIARTK